MEAHGPDADGAALCAFTVASVGSGATSKIHGVNYGGRFVPESFLGLYGTGEILFKDISKPGGSNAISLCDVNSGDMQDRMSQFLDANIKDYHFQKIASLGFNTVRLPLGYWNLIDLPAGTTPSGPEAGRWQNLQNLQPSASSYMKWIDRVFQYAGSVGLKVLLDFHGAPGGQSGNENTGCDLGGDENAFFNTAWNYKLGVQAVEAMAKICASKGSICWGITLLNEPYSPGSGGLSRDALAAFYQNAIAAARQHMSADSPIIVMDWMYWIQNYWESRARSLFGDSGKIVFASHFYEGQAFDLQSAKRTYNGDLNGARDFIASTGFELVVTEYALSNHGDGGSSDYFPYGDMARWLVDEFDQLGGSIVWNFDSYYSAWGPVDKADHVGSGSVPWKEINAGMRGFSAISGEHDRWIVLRALSWLHRALGKTLGEFLERLFWGSWASMRSSVVVV